MGTWEKRMKTTRKQINRDEELSKKEDGSLQIEDAGHKYPTYYEKLSDHLRQYFHLPDLVKVENIKDTVIIQIAVKEDGSMEIRDTLLYSEYPELNQAARWTIRRADRYKPPPLGNSGATEMLFDVTFRFRP